MCLLEYPRAGFNFDRGFNFDTFRAFDWLVSNGFVVFVFLVLEESGSHSSLLCLNPASNYHTNSQILSRIVSG
jgi:hypothetical protein